MYDFYKYCDINEEEYFKLIDIRNMQRYIPNSFKVSEIIKLTKTGDIFYYFINC